MAKAKKLKLMENEHVTVGVPRILSYQRLGDMLAGSLEAGSHYWMLNYTPVAPPKIIRRYDADTVFTHIDYPLNPGGKVKIRCQEPWAKGKSTATLTLKRILKGMNVMAAKYPTHFNDIIMETDDAVTADVFLQCCLFGDAIFG